ncbi:MAG: SdrD B-like domain-containing protein [Saprospiraceae bacterium]
MASPQNQGNDATDSDANPTTGRTGVINLSPNENDPTIDAGFYVEGARIGDFVWEDLDGDGQQDGNEPGVSGVTVNLLDENGNLLETTTTDVNGGYEFIVDPGTYIVEFVNPNGTEFTTPNEGNDATDSDANENNGQTAPITVQSGDNIDTIDAGLVEPASLGDFVWEDQDEDGQQDATEVKVLKA